MRDGEGCARIIASSHFFSSSQELHHGPVEPTPRLRSTHHSEHARKFLGTCYRLVLPNLTHRQLGLGFPPNVSGASSCSLCAGWRSCFLCALPIAPWVSFKPARTQGCCYRFPLKRDVCRRPDPQSPPATRVVGPARIKFSRHLAAQFCRREPNPCPLSNRLLYFSFVSTFVSTFVSNFTVPLPPPGRAAA